MTVLLVGIAMVVSPPPEPAPELIPGVRVEPGIVEFDARVAIDANHPSTPDVYLEMLVTAPDSREHESLLVAQIRPSNLHAGLLAAGFEPGSPVRRRGGAIRAARGDRVRVLVRVEHDGDAAGAEEANDAWRPLTSWIIDDDREHRVADDQRWSGLVFAGSTIDENGYAADRAGTIASLTPFGTEVVSPVWTVSPQASVDTPEWIADNDRVPEQSTRVRVRIVAVGDAEGRELDEKLPEAPEKGTRKGTEKGSEHPERIDIDDG